MERCPAKQASAKGAQMSTSIAPQPFDQRKRLLVVQVLSSAAIVALLFSRPRWNEASPVHEIVEMAGVVLILICIFGRLWSILYVGGRKNSELATSGPYSITRNPLYLFSTIGAFGIGLMFGSIVVAVLLGLFSYLIFSITSRKEEVFLRGKFGQAYETYTAATPRFWPKLWLYRDLSEHTFCPKALRSTFVDALCFLAVFPIIEGIENLHMTGYLPTYFWLF